LETSLLSVSPLCFFIMTPMTLPMSCVCVCVWVCVCVCVCASEFRAKVCVCVCMYASIHVNYCHN
jgi:hypothetical protein